MPTWIHTVEAAAAAGWFAHTVRPGVDQVLHPARRRGRRRLDHAGRQSDGHARLQLQQPVEHPDRGRRPMRRNRRPEGSGGPGAAGAGRAHHGPRPAGTASPAAGSIRRTARPPAPATSTACARSECWNSAMIERVPRPRGAPIPVISGGHGRSSAPRYRPPPRRPVVAPRAVHVRGPRGLPHRERGGARGAPVPGDDLIGPVVAWRAPRPRSAWRRPRTRGLPPPMVTFLVRPEPRPADGHGVPVGRGSSV